MSAAISTPRPRSSTPAISPACSRRTCRSPATFSPTFCRTRCSSKTELDREQQVIVQEIGAARDNPDDHVFDLFQQAAYPDQPIGRTILGTVESVRQLLARHHPRLHGAQLCRRPDGRLRRRQRRSRRLVEIADDRFSGLQARRRAGAAEGPLCRRRAARCCPTTSRPISCSASRAAPTIPTASTPRRFSPRSSAAACRSRLFQEVREKRGLCYSVYAFHWAFADSGIFGVAASTGEERSDRAPARRAR